VSSADPTAHAGDENVTCVRLLPPSLRERLPGPELMDVAEMSDAELAEMLAQLRVINRRLGGLSTTRRALDGLLARVGRPSGSWSVLDIGGGSGDAAEAVLAWGRAPVSVTTMDLDARTAAEAARRLASTPGAKAVRGDLFDVPAKSHDVVHAALFLHHFDGDAAVRALRRMAEIARVGVVVNDLRRHPVPWTLIRWLTAAFSRNRFIRHDAPLSVARAFAADDWPRLGAAAGLDVVARRTWAWRWAVNGVKATT
jgi:SAM-dependent methyltransferase